MKIIKQENNDPIEILIHKKWINLNQDSLHGVYVDRQGAKELIKFLQEFIDETN